MYSFINSQPRLTPLIMQPGILYLLPNLLGTLSPDQSLNEVIPIEVQKITSNLSHFIVENAKNARAFLKLIHANFPLRIPLQEIQMIELNVHTRDEQLTDLLAPLFAGCDVGLISEAGVPAVADPGANLVHLAHLHHIVVRPLVGPSSLLLALMASGLNGQSFVFHGYLPTDISLRKKRLHELEALSHKENQTQMFIETPYRNIAMLEAICANCKPSTKLCVATNLTLTTESIRTMPILEWRTLLTTNQTSELHKQPTVFLFLA